MKNLNSIIIVLVSAFLFSCSVADNQSCDTESLLKNAKDGELEKIEACYKSGANVLVSDSDAVAIYTIAKDNGHGQLATKLQEIQFTEWQKNGAVLEAQLFYDAIEYDNVLLVQKFIEGDFDLKAKHINGVAPIVYAVFNESNKVIKLLLKNGVDVNYEFDFRPLICIAAMFDELETVKILLNGGADINTNDGSGVTPLMFAARDGFNGMVGYLLENGADKTAKDIKEDTALDMAKENGHTIVVQLLQP
jgi:uncharacterized protein